MMTGQLNGVMINDVLRLTALFVTTRAKASFAKTMSDKR